MDCVQEDVRARTGKVWCFECMQEDGGVWNRVGGGVKAKNAVRSWLKKGSATARGAARRRRGSAPRRPKNGVNWWKRWGGKGGEETAWDKLHPT